jgi:uroporphyrinogen decarboxylase
MNDRQRFVATMHYQPRDRAPICDFGFWQETIPEWHKQGLPRHVYWGEKGEHGTVHTDEFFGMDKYACGPSPHVHLTPYFECKVVEDRGDHELVQQHDGVIVLRKKYMGSIPEHHSHLLVDRSSWNQHYKWRLNPDDPARIPSEETWAAWRKVWMDPDYAVPIKASCGSLYGWIRDWMGMENVSLVVYDDPAWFEEMVTTLADVTVAQLTRAFELGARFDCADFWEDMCYSSGPLLSPAHFKRFLVPQYRRITDLLRGHGTDVIWVDCDGKIDDLLPLWLDAGVNCMFPMEVGTWGADPIRFRRQYGKELLMMGGFDKHILAKSKDQITAEVHRLAPLVEEGGYIPFCDHRVPPDVPLENYVHYLHTARKVWGQGINLKPIHV